MLNSDRKYIYSKWRGVPYDVVRVRDGAIHQFKLIKEKNLSTLLQLLNTRAHFASTNLCTCSKVVKGQVAIINIYDMMLINNICVNVILTLR